MAETHSPRAGTLHCVVVTPETTALDVQVDFVALPLYDGELGVAPGHAPLIGRLGYGELRLQDGLHTRRFYIDGGFVQVVDNTVSLLTSRAVPADKIDPAAAAEQLSTLRARPAHGDEQLERREKSEQQARAQLRVAQKEGGSLARPAAH